MEDCSQNKAPENEAIGQQNNKQPCLIDMNEPWDVIPRLDHYRTSRRAKRPSLNTSHEGNLSKIVESQHEEVEKVEDKQKDHKIKLGWIQGVFIPCLLNIWGVMLFLRLSWVVAQAGILQSSGIIGISSTVCVTTTLSLCAISTNGEIRGGGVYFSISRSLGPKYGASIGVVLAFANTVAASMNIIGFCDSLNELLRIHGLMIIDNDVNDVRIIGIMALVVITLTCVVGMEWESKAQNFLIVVIVAAIFNFLIGTIVGPMSLEQEAEGFKGFSRDIFMSNLVSDYRFSEKSVQDFFSVFAIFFPSVTGIQAGANISGDLKQPSRSIPIGTLLALLVSMLSYLIFVFFIGAATVRDAGGLVNGTVVTCVAGHDCMYGMHNTYSVIQLMSLWRPLIYAGCFAATLSTALTNILSVPRIIQALGEDQIYPGLIYFSKPYGRSGEAYRGYALTFIISGLFILIANLNVVAPLISNFYLASYALINFCAFHAALVRPLGWRPSFKYYNTWVSFFGFITCVAIMFLIDWMTSLITCVIVFALYLIVVYRDPDVNWGSSTQAQIFKIALSIIYKLNHINEHVKNYAPHVLALTGSPGARPALVHLAHLISKNNSLLICGDVLPTRLSYDQRSSYIKIGNAWLKQHHVRSFYRMIQDTSLERGASALMQVSGIGKLAPNVVLMGYKTNWLACDYNNLQEYLNIIHDAFDQQLAVLILRTADGLDCSDTTDSNEDDERGNPAQNGLAGNTVVRMADSDFSMSTQISTVQSVPTIGTPFDTNDDTSVIRDSPIGQDAQENPQQKNIAQLNKYNHIPEITTIFQEKHKKGIIDVWWLYDDGGLTILLPYIISTRSNWEHCKIRLFALTNYKQDIDAREKEVKEIMEKARIQYDSLKIIGDIYTKPQQETRFFFDKLISDFRTNNASADHGINNAEIDSLQNKTDQQLRLRELLLENSSQSTLLIVSLPIPKKNIISSPLYMAWLEALTKDMPPTILVRGNHTPALTFYS